MTTPVYSGNKRLSRRKTHQKFSKNPMKYQPGGIKLHQNDVSVINHIIKVVHCQHQRCLWRRFPVWMCNFFNSLHNSWKIQTQIKHTVSLAVSGYRYRVLTWIIQYCAKILSLHIFLYILLLFCFLMLSWGIVLQVSCIPRWDHRDREQNKKQPKSKVLWNVL